MIPITDACVDPRWQGVIAVMGTQMGKTTAFLNVIGQRLDDDPQPILYIGPTKSNVEGVIEPQIQQMIMSAPTLLAKQAGGKRRRKLNKIIAGVSLRLAWAGSATELASQPAHTVLVDERDKMKPIPGEGDPLELANARRATFADGKVYATSSPTEGTVSLEVHPDTGIEHFRPADMDDIQSPIWKLWQTGSRFEWAVPCPMCADYFVPRFRHLIYPKDASPRRASREARLKCPYCAGAIEERHKPEMNVNGHFLAPGMKVVDGKRIGELPDVDWASFWVSGLMSPWKSFGDRASDWVRSVNSHDQETIRTVINTGFGELYAIRGEAPPWESIRAISDASHYELGQVPDGVQMLLLSVDVQKDHLVCVVRGWGAEFESWLIWREEIWGETDKPEVWERLDQFAAREFDGRVIQAYACDSGYRTEQAYTWCERYLGRAYPTKGKDRPQKTYYFTDVEVNRLGKKLPRGLKLCIFDHSYMKGWVHDRLPWPQDRIGAWHLPKGIGEDFCRQIVGEQRMRLPSGRVEWVKSSTNDYLDAEALQVLLAHLEGVRYLRPPSAPAPPATPTPTRGMRSRGVN